ncbi:CDP-glycerol glycerophosphotransferase family protein [Lysobacter panacisoli]|uniref:CDP-glycerol glycerophosphotransferase family protein n=2 Tax=Lysobacter panacisoli TaxID=1255263 RepID=A0ABP9KZT7_9GAMM
MSMPNVLLAARERYALPILQPLAQAYAAAGYAVHAWFDGPLAQAGESMPGPVRMLDLRGVVALKPAAVLCAMDWIPPFFGGAKVQLFHGFNTSKHSDNRGHFRIRNLFDLYCTQGPATTLPFQALSRELGHFAVVETGWSKLDPLFRDDGGAAARMRARAQGRPVAMFASTFTERVSAAPHLYDAIAAQIARGDRYWLLTLHPKCPPELFERYRALACDNASFVEPEDIVTAQRAADVLLSDTTSVVPEFAVQHKPVVTFRHRMPQNYMLDFTEADRLPEMLERAFAPTPELMRAIADYANSIHPYRDGHSSERVIKAVEDLLAGRLGTLKPKPVSAKLRALQIRNRLKYWGPAG